MCLFQLFQNEQGIPEDKTRRRNHERALVPLRTFFYNFFSLAGNTNKIKGHMPDWKGCLNKCQTKC